MPHKLLGDNIGSNERFLHYQIIIPFHLHFSNVRFKCFVKFQMKSFEVLQITDSNVKQIKMVLIKLTSTIVAAFWKLIFNWRNLLN